MRIPYDIRRYATLETLDCICSSETSFLLLLFSNVGITVINEIRCY
jgi:hypothetical protein